MSLWLLEIHPILKFTGSLFLIVYSLRSHGDYNAAKTLVWARDNHWLLETQNESVALSVQNFSYVSAFVSLLHFKTEHKKTMSVVIFNDAVLCEEYRKMRVRFRVEGPKLFEHAKIGS